MVVVSGAAGATGSMVVRIAKTVIGCKKVVGIAGSDDKCRWVESLGADICLNYKSATFSQDLVKGTPDFVDVFYDNVGGAILDIMLTRMARHGRITVCGAIASYNNSTGNGAGLRNWFQVFSMRLEIRGFVVKDYAAQFEEGLAILMRALADGKLTIDANSEHVVDRDFADAPQIWMRLFSGQNRGKLITKL